MSSNQTLQISGTGSQFFLPLQHAGGQHPPTRPPAEARRFMIPFPAETKFKTNQKVKDLIHAAKSDADPVSVFFYGSQEDGTEGAVFVVSDSEKAEQIFKWLKMQKLTSDNPIG